MPYRIHVCCAAQVLRETQSFGSIRTARTPDNSLSLMQLSCRSPGVDDTCAGSAGCTAVRGAAQHSRVRAVSPETSVPSSAEASQWGLWNEATCPEGLDTKNRQGNNPSPDISTGAAVSKPQRHELEGKKRPQTSPELASAGVSSRPSDSDRLDTGEDARSSPRRMLSRLFLQSEMDLSHASRQFAAETHLENSQAQGHSVSFASLPPGILSSTETKRGIVARPVARPATTSAVGGGRENYCYCSCNDRFLGYRGTVPWNRPKSVPIVGVGVSMAEEKMGTQVTDLGINWEAPTPTVWDERQMAMATAAATGQTPAPSRGGKRSGKGGARVVGVSRGGVVIDGRLSKTRKLLRSDVLDAVERAKLPLLQ